RQLLRIVVPRKELDAGLIVSCGKQNGTKLPVDHNFFRHSLNSLQLHCHDTGAYDYVATPNQIPPKGKNGIRERRPHPSPSPMLSAQIRRPDMLQFGAPDGNQESKTLPPSIGPAEIQ